MPRRQSLVRATPGVVRAGSTVHSVLPIGAGPGAWRLIVEADHTRWTAAQQAAASALLDVCASERSEVDDARALVHAVAPANRGSACVVAAGCPIEVLDELVAHVGRGTVHADPLVAVLPATPASRPDLLATLHEAVSVLPGVALGVSDCVTSVADALPVAVSALRLAECRPGPIRVHDATEPATAPNLVSALPDELIRSYVDRVLGPVLDYDRNHLGGLLQTLKVFMACSCSWSKAAAQLHIHVNSLRYRVGRIEDLTGRDLSTLPDQADIHLALHLL
jgi:hypothetical protein